MYPISYSPNVQTLQLIKHANGLVKPEQKTANRFAGPANRDAQAMQAVAC